VPDSSKVSCVERNYDLTRRGKVGATQRYTAREVINILDDAGRVGRRELRTAELAEKLLDLSSRSAPIVRWAYSAFTYEVKRNHAKDPYALPPSVVGVWEGPDEIAQPSSGKIVVESDIERSDSFYDMDMESFGLSKTSPVAFMTAELVVHTRAFWLYASRTHGGIDQLRRVGDSVRMPWSGKTDHVGYAKLFKAEVHRGENTLRFEAVTTRHGREVALLRAYTPYDVLAAGSGYGPTHCELLAHIWVDLASGAIAAGEAYQQNFMSGFPLPDGSQAPIKVRFECSLELIPD
jgi:hypothetical protein